MSAVKHQPATALPWDALVDDKNEMCLKDEQGNDLIGRIDLADYDRPDVERENVEYMAHAANAYPQQIARQQATLAAIGRVDDALQKMGHYALGKILREDMSAIQALLRELGEQDEASRDTGPKLGIVAAVTAEINEMGGTRNGERWWSHRLEGVSVETAIALKEPTHDSNQDAVVMHYCTTGNPTLKRMYQRGRE